MSNENLLGSYIAVWRDVNQMSLRSLATKAGVSPSQISKIENGKTTKPAHETLEKIAYAINVDKHEILALAGMVDDEIKADVAKNISFMLDRHMSLNVHSKRNTEVVDAKYVDSVILQKPATDRLQFTQQAVQAGRLARRSRRKMELVKLADTIEAAIVKESKEKLNEEEVGVLVREMMAAYELTLKRIGKK